MKSLTEEKASALLNCYGFPVMENYLAKSSEDAIKYAKKIGFPVVLKIVSEDIIHKYDVKGVELNLKSVEEVSNAYDSIINNAKSNAPEAKIKGVIVRKMIPKGEEVILGIKNDEAFGPVIMYGMGGIFVEVFEDISFRVAPLKERDIQEMIEETKSSSLLNGARGIAPRDVECLYKCIATLSDLASSIDEINELDINPLILLANI